MFITHSSIHHAANWQRFHITSEKILAQSFRIRPSYFKLPQRAKIQDNSLFTTSMIFFQRSCLRKTVRQPIPIVFNKVAGMNGKTAMETSFFCHLRLRFWCRSESNGTFKRFGTIISAHMNICRIPSISSGGIIWTRRANTDQIRQGFEQNIITRPGPRLITIHGTMLINSRIEKEINCHPTRTGQYTMLSQCCVKVIRTVGMTRISNIVVIFCSTGQGKSIMAPTCVLDDFQEWHHVLIIIFGMQPGHWI